MAYTFNGLKNETNLKFKDISTELYREYLKEGRLIVRIDNPIALNVSKTGGHRVFDAQGVSHYISSKWDHLQWETKEDCPHFVA